MIRVRRGDERGRSDLGWLDSRHTFSFSDYHDPEQMGFRVLRVINEDRVRPGKGFGSHGHRDMEILSWVIDGALQHEDSLGNGSVIRPGEMQRMTAGTGVRHSEFNPSQTDPVHFLQIWILPRAQGLAPGYEQKGFTEEERRDRWRLVASPDGREGTVTLHQDADVYTALIAPGRECVHPVRPGRHVWVQIARGSVTMDGHALHAGDGAACSGESALTLRADAASEALLFDLP